MTYIRTPGAGSGGGAGNNGADAPTIQGTSATALAIGTGSKAFTTQASKGWTVGQRLAAVSAADPTKYMVGVVASYSGTTLTLTVDETGGSGSPADWNINVAGTKGSTGAAGINGSGPLTPQSDWWQNPTQMVASAAGTPTSGTLYLMPMDVGPSSLVIKGLGVNVTTFSVAGSATITVTLGIYKDSGSGGGPDFTQLLGTVTIDPSTSTGIKYTAFGTPITLTAGRYWLAALYYATVAPTTPPSFTAITQSLPLPLPAATAPGTVAKAYAITGFTTSLPTTSQTLAVTGGSSTPCVAARAN